MVKKPYKIVYHSFTDEADGFYSTLSKAKDQIKTWRKEGRQNLRIYKEVFETKEEFEEDQGTEDCIYSKGSFPY
jgi:oligoribonuclease NrnB/cAMP/cGMP phosphodiesterase (DHH superfamily)